jgi:hypothetical protein
MLLALALALAAACLAAAIALPSIDPCRVGDQFIPGCPLPTDDRIGLRLMIGGAGVVAGAVILWVRAIEKGRASLGQWQLSAADVRRHSVTGVMRPHKAAASGGEADRHVNRAGHLNLLTGSRVLVNDGAGKFL